ncbi:up-regulator of cell proliferation-like [Osmerus eperlanus]|uniref:up-regulator of cell proliferation-like n=1 Tax=Osmerus eperlanus TaxID=29151 RepID=UPI002E14D50A
MYKVEITGLQSGQKYEFQVFTEGDHGNHSDWVSATVTTVVPAPQEIKVIQCEATQLRLQWSKAPGIDHIPQSFLVTCSSPGSEPQAVHTEDSSRTLTDLQPETQYTVGVCTVLSNGERSEPASVTIYTTVPVPVKLTVVSVDATSATVSWEQPDGMNQTQLQYQVSYQSPGTDQLTTTTTSSLSITLSDLRPASEYSVRVCSVLECGLKSQPVSHTFSTRSCLREMLSKTGLKEHYDHKLTLSSVLEINSNTTSDETITSLPEAFLKNLILANANARVVKCLTSGHSVSCSARDSHDKLENINAFNPVDLTTAMFLCSDSFLQQEMVLKMSMCQFAVPLLLPNCDTRQNTLMLWTLRDLIKKFPPRQAESKLLTEERVVQADIPMVSFVRLGEDRLSKSQIVNKLISSPQQYHDTFVHEGMECGDVPRRISDGLVEISWYLPSKNNTDMFSNPMAVANLRGDVRRLETQFSFLCETSAAVVIFCENSEAAYHVLKGKQTKAELLLVVNSETEKMFINPTNVIVRKKHNDQEVVRKLQISIGRIIEKSYNNMKMEGMASIARQFGIVVDEDNPECQEAKTLAERITNKIIDTVKFKEEQLPLQGKVWKELSKLEKEECRLLKAGETNIQAYKRQLSSQKEQLRNEQQSQGMSDAMKMFVQGMSSPVVQRSNFFKWLRIYLDDRSRQNLSGSRKRYKNLCTEKKDEIADLDRHISDCSLGLEHFLRELGQLYELACCLPENSPQRKEMENLPRLCAQMLLDGFPIEVVDGHASNIPRRWISDVLTSLHGLVENKSRIKVVSVLGVQNTGKSTLLNTMFGVKFAVSSGFNTRGAFMHLIKVDAEQKKDLECDFVMVIDTEGLKDPELAQLSDSYEHDNELATLVIGLSDVTIFNINVVNLAEMKDILQIVVHAFIRMEDLLEEKRKPICHFVHQNVSATSDYHVREQKQTLSDLDEVTLFAARMENKENVTRFTDVMEYDTDTKDTYIPGLWHGTPPMATVSSGYSEAVYNFKKKLLQDLAKSRKRGDLTDFNKSVDSLWGMVMYENFLFTFKNSRTADAYNKLRDEYIDWEWSFDKEIQSWIVPAQNKIRDFSMSAPHSQMSLNSMLQDLLREASKKVSKAEHQIQNKLQKYLETQDAQNNVLEKHREEFITRSNMLRQETEDTMKSQLQKAVQLKEGKTELHDLEQSLAQEIDRKVRDMLQKCRGSNTESSESLKEEFESMWEQFRSQMHFKPPPQKDVADDATSMLRRNLSTRGSQVNKLLLKTDFKTCGTQEFVMKSGNIWDKTKLAMRFMDSDRQRKMQQDLCQTILKQCQDFMEQKLNSKSNYSDKYIKDLLDMVDQRLRQEKTLQLGDQCETLLKLHICGKAARTFQKMHDDYIKQNDPHKYLEQSKEESFKRFKDLFNKQRIRSSKRSLHRGII